MVIPRSLPWLLLLASCQWLQAEAEPPTSPTPSEEAPDEAADTTNPDAPDTGLHTDSLQECDCADPTTCVDPEVCCVDPAFDCLVAVYRHKTSQPDERRCYTLSGDTTAPDCPDFSREIEAWIGVRYPTDGSVTLLRCSQQKNHHVVSQGSPRHIELQAGGYDCSASMGDSLAANAPTPPQASTLGLERCPLVVLEAPAWVGGIYHLATRGPEALHAAACERRQLGDVFTLHSCFVERPPPCDP